MLWQNGTQLKEFDGEKFEYDGLGRRIKKNDIEYTYDNDGRLIKQSNGLEYIYDNSGLAGVIYNGATYFYRKDIQGNIIAILDSTGVVVVKYIYDAWGNFSILNGEGKPLSGAYHIGYVNPFRYRGYYYDHEVGMYYLQTRYYDPEIGRFISQDNIDYADPEMINGLNLYAYCGNNPVMNIDPTGKFFLSLIVAAVVGAVVSAAVSVISQLVITGTLDWAKVGISALFGGIGGALAFTGVGGVFGQFIIQGVLAVGETVSLAAVDGSLSSLGIEHIVATFMFAGALGTIGAKGASQGFKRIGQIEASFITALKKGATNGGFAGFKLAFINKSGKYFSEFLKPLIVSSSVIGGITGIASIADFWIQKLYNKFN